MQERCVVSEVLARYAKEWLEISRPISLGKAYLKQPCNIEHVTDELIVRAANQYSVNGDVSDRVEAVADQPNRFIAK